MEDFRKDQRPIAERNLKNSIILEQIAKDEKIEISTKNQEGIDKLKQKIIEMYNLDKIELNDITYLCNARSISLLVKALAKIEESIKEIKNNAPIDIVELSLKESWDLLGSIIGETYSDELINEMFKRFCLGK